MSGKYFKLSPESHLVLGCKCSLIHNLLSDEIIWLNEENTRIVSEAETGKAYIHPDSVLDDLVTMGWGCFNEKKIFIDKIRTTNIFSQKRMWKNTPFINYAVLQLTNSCNLDCSFCKETFCPTCIRLPIVPDKNELSTREWMQIINELKAFGTNMILLTGGEVALRKDLHQIIDYALKLDIKVNVHTNGLIPIRGLQDAVNITISVLKETYVETIIENYYDNKFLNLLAVNIDRQYLASKARKGWNIINVSIEPPLIRKSTLLKTDIFGYFARKLTDSCLNGKVAIAYNGDVFPCLGYKGEGIVNLHHGNISDAVKVLVDDFWNTPVNLVSDKCKLCEFRYACNTCRMLDSNSQCNYDLEESVWK